ncbi:hypothetical protein ACTFIY_005401 [Dictyostelium cf. discoideum]
MKFLAVLCIFIFTVAFAYANHYGCYTNNPCGAGRICHTSKGSCNCIEISKCLDVTLETSKKSEWDSNGTHLAQYDFQIKNNNLVSDISNLFIGVNPNIAANDYVQIWNIRRMENGELTLPTYIPAIERNTTFGFGAIIAGYNEPNFVIYAVTY